MGFEEVNLDRDDPGREHAHGENALGEGKSETDEFDEILELAGSQGKYQKILVFAVLGPIIMVQPIFTLNALFMLYEPDHWCHVPGNRNGLDLAAWKNLTIPTEIGIGEESLYSQCKMYGNDSEIIECQHGWEYDKKDYDLTIPSEYNWVCARGHYATDALTFYAVGNCVGALIFGWGADKFGRRPVFFLTVFINVFFRVVSLFVPHCFLLFLVVQFIIGTAFPVMYITPSMIAAEMSDKEYRGFIYAFTWVIWVVGMALLPLLAWATRHWFIIGLVTSVPGILVFGLWNYLPESPRWLISVGRTEEAAVIIQKVAETNGRSDKVPREKLETMLKTVVLKQENFQKNVGAWTLFSKPILAKNTIMLTISWSMNALVYYGITLNASNMSGNQFLNFFILAIIEVPSGWLGGYLVDRTGRRWTQVAFFALCIVAFIGAAIGVTHNIQSLVILSIVAAKFCVTLTFLVVYLQGTEIFPTQLRSTGSGFASTTSSAIGITGPYLVYLGKLNPTLPYIAMAVLSLLGILASLFLPETLHRSLPESIDDANGIGTDASFWSYLPYKQGNLEKKKNQALTNHDNQKSTNQS